ncbi:LysR substrate-binding domain-containing protein [Hydrogenophaga laconesensis]|uniref:DNA-binding transcriptional LysR family regulator n=1 Tax=Hydrogenophaga laconesensis TaxID=1805971 RepID=A0ABU1VAG2_9BURK|nr:LysR substrate-binding domain-containing protein [Hydrogenophaga laconesensis]MDR7094298.1 DNA-binding transcriptional LysR family regulator [Hydrogenophaga laconesensis]
MKATPDTLPRSQMLRLDLLPCFDAAARTLSFTLAAQELHLTQSAVSRQIQLLEESLGVPLFERRHRALALTEAGEVMQRATRDALERLRDASARVRPGPRLRQVAMTCTQGFASLWLIPRLARFTANHPEVDVRISASMAIMDLERHRLDMAVRFVPSSIGPGKALFEETLQPLCAPSLLRQKTAPLRQPADLARHTLLTVEKHAGTALTSDWDPWFQVMGLQDMRMKNTVQFTQYADAVAAAVAGQGVVIGRLPLLQSLVDAKQLVAPFRSGGAATRRGYYVEMAAHAHDNADALDFANWLRAEAERG